MKNNYHDIYLSRLKEHLTDYDYYNCPRDQFQYEKLFSHFTLSNPVERVCYCKQRCANIIFQFAEVIWYLSGSDEAEFISYYAPSIAKYSADGKTLPGTAYGKKIFSFNNFLNQWENAKDELKKHSETKRCVISIFSPLELLDKDNIDVSCTLSLQFILRNNYLHLITTMRANDVYRGALSDVFSFTFLQELMARELQCEIGIYHHQVASTHLYSSDKEKAQQVINNIQSFESYSLSFPTMPKLNNTDTLAIVLECEQALRNNIPYDKIKDRLDLVDSYWKDIIILFEIYRELKHNEKIKWIYIETLNSTIRYLLMNFLDSKGVSYELE